MAIPPRYTTDDDLRRYLRGDRGRGLPGSPMTTPGMHMPSLPARGLSPPAPATPAPAAPAAAPSGAAPASPAPTAAPAPQQAPPQSRVPPQVAEYASRFASAKPPPRPMNQTIGSLFAAIGSGLNRQPYDAQYFDGLDDRREAKFEQQQARDQAAEQKMIAEEEAIPTSKRSLAAQQRMTPMLTQLGLSPEEISTLSAADIKGMAQGGNLATTVAEARAKARAALEKAEADRVAEEAKRAADFEDFQKKNAITAPQAMDRALAMSGASTERMLKGALLQDELSSRRAAENDARDAAARQAAAVAEEERKIAEEIRKAEGSEAGERIALQRMKERLQARGDEKLPGQKGKLDEFGNEIESAFVGGTGMSDEDSRLDTDLNALGMAAFRNRSGSSANTESDIATSKRMFRGNGTAASAMAAIDERLRELDKTQQARRFASERNKRGAVPVGPVAEPATPGWEQPKTFPPVPDGMVRIQLPDGSTKVGPKTAVEQALKLYPGAKVVE